MKRILKLIKNLIVVRTIRTFWLDRQYRDLIYVTLFVLLLGTVVYHFLEGWSWLDALYFSVVTLTTVGFGDYAPQTDGGKLFTILYIIIGIGIILTFIEAVYTHFNQLTIKIKRNME